MRSKTLCIAGKNDIAVNVLEYALQHCKGCNIIAVLNQDESYIDSWQHSAGLCCSHNNIPVVSLEDIYSVSDLVFISVEFDRIIDPSKFVSGNLFNIHFSLLPKYKGCNTSILPILHGETESGVTLHRIRRGIDPGEIIAQRKVTIDYDCTSLELYKNLIEAGSRLVIEYLDKLIRNDFTETPQDFMNSVYFARKEIDYSTLRLDTNRTAWQIHNQIRAFAFRPYQLLTFKGFGLIGSTITGNVSTERPGTILEETETHFLLSTIDYDICIYKDVLNELLAAVRDDDNERAECLCEFRRVINETDNNGMSPMSIAQSRNNSALIQFFTIDNDELGRYNQNTEHRAQSLNLSQKHNRKLYVLPENKYLNGRAFYFVREEEQLCISAS